ncbi:MAG: hypothetical protein RLZZ502_1935 [Pseudomonadota bacterium]
MPTYQYQCTTCDKQFEHVQRMSDDALKNCLCEKKGDVHRIITTTNFSLKGSGWYVTDFRGGSKSSNNNNADKSENTSSASTNDSSSGSAPAAAPSSSGSPGSSDTSSSSTTPSPTTPTA